jgi:hypothetical protein
MINEFQKAIYAAEIRPDRWHQVIVREGVSRPITVGRVCVVRDEVDPSGALVTRFLLLLTKAPFGIRLCDDWEEERVLGVVLPYDEPVAFAYDCLPPGTNIKPNELAVMQVVLEED